MAVQKGKYHEFLLSFFEFLVTRQNSPTMRGLKSPLGDLGVKSQVVTFNK